jgi:twitching motility protein PilT
MNIDFLLKIAGERKASDLHLKVGRPPLLRIFGRIVPTEFEKITPEMIKELVYPIMNSYQIQKFEEEWEIDFSYSLKDIARFRVNLFYQKGTIGAVFRMIPYKIPEIDELSLPPVLKDLSLKPQGLILVTGPTGCGKTTTLAAMINYINQIRECHIMTIEDPIEFVYRDNRAEINQREIGADTKSFASALKHVLRQDPDVILVGEMRDLETISTVITAAETGHLVFSTLHTNDAKQTIDRIIDSFPAHQQQQVRLQLASTLVAVISQRLVRRSDGNGRIAAIEVMINSPTIKKLIEEGNTSGINKAIESSVTYYRMQSLNQSLVKLVQDGIITEEEALSVTPNPDEFRLNLKGIFSGSSIERSSDNLYYGE